MPKNSPVHKFRKQTARKPINDIKGFIDVMVAALRRHENQEDLFQMLGEEEPKQTCAIIIQNMERQAKYRNNLEWFQIFYLGAYIREYKHDFCPEESEEVDRDLDIPKDYYYLAMFMAKVFENRQDAIRHIHSCGVYHGVRLSARSLQRAAEWLLVSFPIPEVEDTPVPSRTGTPTTSQPASPEPSPPVSPTPTLVNEYDLPSPPAITDVWTNPDLHPDLVDIAEGLSPHPSLPPSTIQFPWDDEAEQVIQDFLGDAST